MELGCWGLARGRRWADWLLRLGDGNAPPPTHPRCAGFPPPVPAQQHPGLLAPVVTAPGQAAAGGPTAAQLAQSAAAAGAPAPAPQQQQLPAVTQQQMQYHMAVQQAMMAAQSMQPPADYTLMLTQQPPEGGPARVMPHKVPQQFFLDHPQQWPVWLSPQVRANPALAAQMQTQMTYHYVQWHKSEWAPPPAAAPPLGWSCRPARAPRHPSQPFPARLRVQSGRPLPRPRASRPPRSEPSRGRGRRGQCRPRPTPW